MADPSDDELRAAQAEVITFWFTELTREDWFRSDPALDERVRERFGWLHPFAARAELFAWRDDAEGRLAEILVLDQLSRNMFRGRPEAFATDPLALALAQEAVRGGWDQLLPDSMRPFVYMPYMHSESRRVHVEAERLFEGTPSMDYVS